MLKRLLIAVLALSFIMAFTGTAFSDVYPDGDVGGKAVVRFDASNPKASQAELIHPLQTAQRPSTDLVEYQLPGGSIAGPPLATFCFDQNLWYTSGSVYYWDVYAGSAGDDLYNTRYTADENFDCTLYYMWQYVADVFGTADMMCYLYDDDGTGLPGTALDSILVPNASLALGWNLIDFYSSPNAPAGGWVFSDGEKYHYAVRPVGVAGVDGIRLYTDQGEEPNYGDITSAYDNVAGAWGTLFAWYGLQLDLLQSSEYCAGEIPFSDCYSLEYFNILWYTWQTPDPNWGNAWYSQAFTAASAVDTLVSVDVYIFSSSDLSFGRSDVVVNLHADDGLGAPGALLSSTTLVDGSYVPGWNNIPVNMVMTGDYHVAITSTNHTLGVGDTLADGSPDNFEKFVSDDGLNPQGRSFTSYDGISWIPMLSDWGIDVNFAIAANVCRDPFADCKIAGPHFDGSLAQAWSLGGLFRQAGGTRMTALGENCQVKEVGFSFYDFGDPLENAYTTDTKISVYTDAAGLPGTEIASIMIAGGTYVNFPADHIVDFTSLDVYVTGDYWIVAESQAIHDTTGATPFEGVYLIGDGGASDNEARYAIVYGIPHPNAGIWRTALDRYGADFGIISTSATCCIPFGERTCLPGTDAGWSTFQGNQGRTGASELSLGDAWCNLNLNWSFDGPGSVSFTGPVISGDMAVCSFSDRYIVFDIITGAVAYTLDGTLGDGNLLGSSIRCAPSIVGGVMYIAGGATNGIGAVDFATGALVWQRTIGTEGPTGIFGQTRFSVMTVLNDGVDDVLYTTTDNGAVVAMYAATGVLYAGWATNPVYLTGSPFISGATDGTNLFYSTQSGAAEGEIYSIDAVTGAINWQLSGTDGLAAADYALGEGIGYSYPEGFRGGVAYQQGALYAVSWGNDGGANDFPIDGFFYSIDAGSGSHILPPTRTNRAIYSTVVVDQNAIYAPTLSQWANPTDPTGGNLIAFAKSSGAQLWGAKTGDDANYYSTGILSCEPDGVDDKLYIFNANGFFECYNTNDGDQLFRRRVDHGGGAGEIGFAGALAMTATDGIHMMFADFYGGLYDFTLGADRPRLEIQSYQPFVAVEFGANPALPVNVGPIIVNTGCADLNIASASVDEAPITGSQLPAFSAGYVTDDNMQRSYTIADEMNKAVEFAKFTQLEDNLFNTEGAVFNVRSSENNKATSNFAAGIPAWFVSLDAPIGGDVIAAGDSADLLITVNQPLISRGPQSVYVAWDSDDPDFFLNGAADAAGLLPEILLTIVGGCLVDTTTLNFGVGAANIQLVTNTGRLGTGDWTPHGFEIDGDGSSYYQGSYIYGASTYSIAWNSQDWSSGGGEVDSWNSLQPDPNYCDNQCKAALTAGVNVGAITSDGGLTYDPILADMVCKTFLDSCENFDTDPDPLNTVWDWSVIPAPFDDTLSMGLMVNSRVIGAQDNALLANLTLEIFDFTERNGDSVTNWYFGQITDYDVGGDDAAIDRDISTAWSFNPGGDAAWGSTKIPFGCGTVGAGQDFDYVALRNAKQLDGNSALFDINAYFDSAYIYLSGPLGLMPAQVQAADGEMHTGYSAHNFGPNGTFSIGVANFGITSGLADNTSSGELAGMAHLVNKWAGFGRGDVNDDGGINLADIIYLAATVNNGGPGAVPFAHLSDVNADNAVDALDINYLVDYYFNCGPCPMGDWMF